MIFYSIMQFYYFVLCVLMRGFCFFNDAGNDIQHCHQCVAFSGSRKSNLLTFDIKVQEKRLLLHEFSPFQCSLFWGRHILGCVVLALSFVSFFLVFREMWACLMVNLFMIFFLFDFQKRGKKRRRKKEKGKERYLEANVTKIPKVRYPFVIRSSLVLRSMEQQ